MKVKPKPKVGRVFLRGSTYWIAYRLHGEEIRETAKTDNEQLALDFLRRRIDEVGADRIGAKKFLSPQSQKLTASEVLNDLENDLKTRDRWGYQTGLKFDVLREAFGSRCAVDITEDVIDRYIARLLAEGYAKATVNRNTQLLGQALKRAARKKLIPEAPHVTRLSEKGNEREGFFSEQEIRAVIRYLPDDLADFTLFGWLTGMRKGEIASLRWENLDGDVIRLRAADAKTREARLIPLVGELAELIERREFARKIEDGATTVLSPLIFHRKGAPISHFGELWNGACQKAGVGQLFCRPCRVPVDLQRKCPKCGVVNTDTRTLTYKGRIFHDLRRSACRNMIRAGVSQHVAMKISGHKTDMMFRRYNITAEEDLRAALTLTQAHLKQQKAKVVSMQSREDDFEARTKRGQNRVSGYALNVEKGVPGPYCARL